jgi:hypothetical protein
MMPSTFRSPSSGVVKKTALDEGDALNYTQEELPFTYEQALNEKMPKLPPNLPSQSYAYSPSSSYPMPFSTSYDMEDPFTLRNNSLPSHKANKNDCPVLLSINQETLHVVVPKYLVQRNPAELHQRAVTLLTWFRISKPQHLSKRIAIPPHIKEFSNHMFPMIAAYNSLGSSRVSSPTPMELTPASTPSTSASSNYSSPLRQFDLKDSPLSSQLPPILSPSRSLTRISINSISSITSFPSKPISSPSHLSTLLSTSQALASRTQDNLMESLYHSLLLPITDLLQHLYPPSHYLLDMYYSTRHRGISVDFSWALRSCAHCATMSGQSEELLIFAAIKLLPPGVLRAADFSEAWVSQGTALSAPERDGETKIKGAAKRVLQDAWQIHEALKTKGVMFWDGEFLLLVEFGKKKTSGMLVRDDYGAGERGYGRHIVLGYLVDALDKMLGKKNIESNGEFWEWERNMNGVQNVKNKNSSRAREMR